MAPPVLNKKGKPPRKMSSKKKKTSKSPKSLTKVKVNKSTLVNQATRTGQQQTIVRINNALAKANGRVNRRYNGIPRTNTLPSSSSSNVLAPAFNINFPSLGANYDNGMREVQGMRNDIMNEFQRVNPAALYAPPPMTVHPDVMYDASSLGYGSGSGVAASASADIPVSHSASQAEGSASSQPTIYLQRLLLQLQRQKHLEPWLH